jgi:uncharacterized protein with von Willebrand factor type A (vWA) domain
MAHSNVTVTLSAADKATIKQKVQDILALLPFIINLTLEERKALPKMGNHRYTFVKRLIQAVKENSAHIPASYDIAALEQDFSGYDDINEVRIPVIQLLEKMDDTMRAAGAEAYLKALQGKELLEAANRTESGMDNIMKELQEFFDHAQQEEEQTGGEPPPPPPPSPAE